MASQSLADKAMAAFLQGTVPAGAKTLADLGYGGSGGGAMDIVTLQNNAAQNIADTTNVPVTFSGLLGTDPVGFWNAGTPARLTIPVGKDGIYNIEGNIQFAGSALGTIRNLKIVVSGVVVVEFPKNPAPAAIPTALDLEKTVRLVAGDWVELWAFQDTAAILQVLSTAPRTPSFTLTRLSA